MAKKSEAVRKWRPNVSCTENLQSTERCATDRRDVITHWINPQSSVDMMHEEPYNIHTAPDTDRSSQMIEERNPVHH